LLHKWAESRGHKNNIIEECCLWGNIENKNKTMDEEIRQE